MKDVNFYCHAQHNHNYYPNYIKFLNMQVTTELQYLIAIHKTQLPRSVYHKKMAAFVSHPVE